MFTPPRNKTKLLIRAIVSLSLLAGGAYWLNAKYRLRAQAKTQSQQMPLTVDAQSLNFGEVWDDSRFHWKVPLRNRTDHELEVDDVFTSCTCSVVESKKFVVPPGATHDVELVIDLTRQSGTAETNGVREFAVKFAPTVRGDDGKPVKAAWQVEGRVRTAFRLSPRLIDFGTQSVEGQPFAPQRLEVISQFPLDELRAVCSSEHFKTEVRRLPDSDSRYELTVIPNKPLAVGPIKAEVRLHARSAQYPTIPVQFITLTGQVVEDVQAIPASISVGSRTIGEVAEDVLTLESLTRRGFTVERSEARGEGLNIERLPGEIVAFKVRQIAQVLHEQKSEVVLQIRSAAGRQFTLIVPVDYYGIGIADHAR